MPISKFPELEGALFPSSTAMELAEKRVLAQRAEAQRKEDERKAAEEVSSALMSSSFLLTNPILDPILG